MWWFVVALASPVRWEMVRSGQPGVSSPKVIVTADIETEIDVRLRCGGRSYRLHQQTSTTSQMVLEIAGLKQGEHSCTGTIALPEMNQEATLNFDVSLIGELTFEVLPDDVDLAQKTVLLHPSRPVKEVEISRIGLNGEVVGTVTVNTSDPLTPRGTWTESEEDWVHLDVVARDNDGFGSTLRLTPWSYEIPHEDVVFESGQAQILSAEEPKLMACLKDIRRVEARFGASIPMSLYVAGYTDTVGPASSNRALSRRRATAIGQWFRGHGFAKPILVGGFGEQVLSEATADETANEANRRALYILGVSPPSGSSFPGGGFQPL